MRKHRKCRKKYRRRKITVIHNHFYEKPIDKVEENKTTELAEKQKIGFWKSVWMIIGNKEPKSGNTTAYVLAEVMAWVFNVIAICALILFALLGYVIIMRLDWNFDLKIEWAYFIAQMFSSMLLLGISLTISLIFRAVANDIKAEKDRNYITTLFFGFTSLASLIVALVALFKGVG